MSISSALRRPNDYRRGGDPGTLISTYDGSYRLHNKLYWDEVDTRTHLCTSLVHYRTATLDETVAVLQRSFGYSLTKGTGLWWFLLAGNATFQPGGSDGCDRGDEACR